MPKHPGESGLLPRLDNLQHQINELSRRSGHAATCVVRLNANVAVGEGADMRPVTSWKPTAETDSTGMFHYNEDGDTWWQLTHGGRFRVLVSSLWSAYGVFDAARPPIVGTSILLNSSGTHAPASFGIAQATTCNFNVSVAYPLICEDRVFTTGDQLRVNFWSQYGGTVQAQQLHTFTHVVIRYLGPD